VAPDDAAAVSPQTVVPPSSTPATATGAGEAITRPTAPAVRLPATGAGPPAGPPPAARVLLALPLAAFALLSLRRRTR
jgi:hypothetical protein